MDDQIRDNVYLSVEDIQKILSIGKNTAYKLMKIDGFPAVKIGRKYIVKKTFFYDWLDSYQGEKIAL